MSSSKGSVPSTVTSGTDEQDKAKSSSVEASRTFEGPSTIDQRRGHRRYPVDLQVDFSSEAGPTRGRAENLSARGAFVITDGDFRVGDQLDVTITLPTEEKIVVRGVARWLREYLEPNGTPPGAGVEFVDVQGEQALLAFLEGRESLFPEND